ncbi:MAG: adenylosuccinate synthase [Planctomycetota bacterium]|nr:adenylosuccinate synthase [Planctomycetota bacterium]
MPVTCVFGAQWGDEGKGKVVDYLADGADYVVRYQGGANAGHTIRVGDESFALRLTPSGVLRGSIGVIANGVVIDPRVLLEEMELVAARGIRPEDSLRISDRAHLVLPFHPPLDRALDAARSDAWRVGTTGRGVSTAIADKHSYDGFRVIDLMSERMRAERLPYLLERGNERLRTAGAEPLDLTATLAEIESWVPRLRPMVCDTVALLHRAREEDRTVLLEGAQASLLDVDFGTYPFTTSSNTGVAGVASGTGLPARAVDRVLAVAKAYTTRVGRGPFPTEEKGEVGRRLQEYGCEFGTVTGRPRRCGWFDAVGVRHVCRLNGVDGIALTKIDVLSGIDPLRICVAYQVDGRVIEDFPADPDVLGRCEPIYQDVPGFMESLTDARSVDDLPERARAYVAALEQQVGARVEILSVGPERTETVAMGAPGA